MGQEWLHNPVGLCEHGSREQDPLGRPRERGGLWAVPRALWDLLREKIRLPKHLNLQEMSGGAVKNPIATFRLWLQETENHVTKCDVRITNPSEVASTRREHFRDLRNE